MQTLIAMDPPEHTTEATSRKITERLKKEWGSGVRDEHSDKLKASWEIS